MSDRDDDAVWRTDNRELLKRLRKIMKDDVATHKALVEECKTRWNRSPLAFEQGAWWTMAGLSLRTLDHDEREERWRAEQKAAEPDRHYFGLMPQDEPPSGWRKRQKDTYFTPPIKGGGPDADVARELMSRYRRVPNARSLLVECGAQAEHFAGLRLIAPGVKIVKGVIYVRAGAGYKIPDDRWQTMKLSEYLALEGK